MIISFGEWRRSKRWYNIGLGALVVVLERWYCNGKPTPICWIRKVKIISVEEWDKDGIAMGNLLQSGGEEE